MRGGHMSWVINGDISKCFDRIPHDVIMKEIKNHISCARTLSLIERSLMAGFIYENGVRQKSTIGTPQGSILSPLLANIVLNKLDQFMASHHDTLNFGKKRKKNPQYEKLVNRRKYYKLRNPDIARQALLDMRKITRYDMSDRSYGRSLYIRYADYFVVLMAHPLVEAGKLKSQITDFLKKECGLDLNQEKTTITSTREGFKFLGA